MTYSTPTMEPVVLSGCGQLMNAIDPESIRGVRLTASSPERKLAAAIIVQAVNDARGNFQACPSRRIRRAIIANANAWLADHTSPNHYGGAAWGLAFCATVLDCPPEAAARRAMALVQSDAVMPRLRRARFQGARHEKVRARRRTAA